MSDPTDFLLARIAEDEEVAREAQDLAGVPWRATHGRQVEEARDGYLVTPEDEHSDSDEPSDSVAVHIARHDPVRVLAECEAKRRIVEAFEEERVRRDIYNRDYDGGEYDFNENDLRARLASNAECRGLEIAMQAHAAVYADHPNFKEEWRS